MPIDFHAEQNKFSYAGRTADESWADAIRTIVNPTGLLVADIGCGGGIYSKAWREMGAAQVIGVDTSSTMIAAAKENCAGLTGISFVEGDAANTGLPQGSVDIVFERALIHHLPALSPCLNEALRLLKTGGKLIIQDRTPEDISIPGSNEHIRGYFFEFFPELLQVELGRRRTRQTVLDELQNAGLDGAIAQTLWETRKIYPTRAELLNELHERKGRSILHELGDDDIQTLVSRIASKLAAADSITEKDRWTLWVAVKP